MNKIVLILKLKNNADFFLKNSLKNILIGLIFNTSMYIFVLQSFI